ncbi:hypothetical protein U0070_001551 [Myodes glareolus]|uniref:Uncharacterized protein n=1 Tax=Myodes glareolus TaxID=447135 RepID=A0AAW0IDQ0_MYOGA
MGIQKAQWKHWSQLKLEPFSVGTRVESYLTPPAQGLLEEGVHASLIKDGRARSKGVGDRVSLKIVGTLDPKQSDFPSPCHSPVLVLTSQLFRDTSTAKMVNVPKTRRTLCKKRGKHQSHNMAQDEKDSGSLYAPGKQRYHWKQSVVIMGKQSQFFQKEAKIAKKMVLRGLLPAPPLYSSLPTTIGRDCSRLGLTTAGAGRMYPSAMSQWLTWPKDPNVPGPYSTEQALNLILRLKIRSLYVAQAGHEFTAIFLLQSSDFWDYRPVAPDLPRQGLAI